MEKSIEITTKDMHLAAVLVSYGSQITSVDKTDPKKQYFHFEKLPVHVISCDPQGNPIKLEIFSIDEIKALMISKKIFFPPSFLDCLRSVKSYLYSE